MGLSVSITTLSASWPEGLAPALPNLVQSLPDQGAEMLSLVPARRYSHPEELQPTDFYKLIKVGMDLDYLSGVKWILRASTSK